MGDEEIDHAFKERWFVSLDPMTGKKQHPPAYKKHQTNAPPREAQKHDTSDDHGNSYGVQHLVSGIGVLVVILRHVVSQ